MTATRNWNAIVRQAIVAGIAAGILIEAYLLATARANPMQAWQWIASAAVGDVAFTSPSYAWLGLAVHFVVSVGWAGGYAYLAQDRPYMNARWLISGLVYGLLVYVFMDLILLGARKLVPPTPLEFLNALVAHCVFFGLPLAFVVARMDRARS